MKIQTTLAHSSRIHWLHSWLQLCIFVDTSSARSSRSTTSWKVSSRTSWRFHTITGSSKYFQVKFEGTIRQCNFIQIFRLKQKKIIFLIWIQQKISKPKAEHNKMNISTYQQLESRGDTSSAVNASKKVQAQKRPSKMRVAANFNFPSNSVDKD